MKNSNGWIDDFRDFLEVDNTPPPNSLAKKIDDTVYADLHPSFYRVIIKQLLILVFATPLILLFCPQFGLSFGSHPIFPMSIFMSFGRTGCMVACGALFMGTVVTISLISFRPEEVRMIRESRFLYYSLLSVTSLGAFVCAGADVFLELGVAWFVGATAIALTIYEANYQVRIAQFTK